MRSHPQGSNRWMRGACRGAGVAPSAALQLEADELMLFPEIPTLLPQVRKGTGLPCFLKSLSLSESSKELKPDYSYQWMIPGEGFPI